MSERPTEAQLALLIHKLRYAADGEFSQPVTPTEAALLLRLIGDRGEEGEDDGV